MFGRSAEHAHANFVPGDSFVAEGYTREVNYERNSQSVENEEFVAKIDHDAARRLCNQAFFTKVFIDEDGELRAKESNRIETVVEELDVNTPGVSTPVRRLSGGNVQKVLVGREIASAPTVLLTAYAVRGLDINASYTIYDLINRQKERGVAVIYVGEDLDVLLELADRILVLCGGKVSGIVPGRGATKRDVGMMMTQLGGNEAHA